MIVALIIHFARQLHFVTSKVLRKVKEYDGLHFMTCKNF